MIRTGIDIIEISRVAEKVQKNEDFKKRILTDAEIEYCNSKVNGVKTQDKQFQSIAGIYAAKEAFFKALGTGIGAVSNLKKVEVCHEGCGAPFIRVLDEEIKKNIGGTQNISISISHDGNMAIAICIIES